ncbi:MAG: class I SAM-dependent methyltransferase [Ruminococcus sp.]|nr:class I SAM-dependent methyltransferase [Ruminococcus sp.]
MAFKLESVVPWGRNFSEYTQMFLLTHGDMQKRIAGFGDGPASFNKQATDLGCSVTSFDPIYAFTKQQLEARISEVRDIVMQQMAENSHNYVWDRIHSLKELEQVRMAAMKVFLDDFEKGKSEGRYICHELPRRLPFPDDSFDIGLSSHFLLMYTSLGLDLHIKAISEMLRVCAQVRIFPLCDLDSNDSEMIQSVIAHFAKSFDTQIKQTPYRFQKGADRLLIISRKQ